MARVLSRIPRRADDRLLVGYDGADDAAVYRLNEREAIVCTTDFFPPMIDDPEQFGAVAAANALSDVFAMGGRPLVALNIVGFPSKKLDLEVLEAILIGGAKKVAEAQAVVGGGHSVEDAEIKYGLAVTGTVDPEKVWKNSAVRVGDRLILTKPIGTGLITSATKVNGDDGPVVQEAIRWMATLNGLGIEHLHAARISGVTDITGFGLLGHARELVQNSGATIAIDAGAVPLINGIAGYFKDRFKTRGARESRAHVGDAVALPHDLDPWTNELLFDPQTSGGLLVAIHPDDAEVTLERLRSSGLEQAAFIGEVIAPEDGVDVRVS